MRRKPDMAAGTRSAALSLNTSAVAVTTRRISTPLGERWTVAVVTASGRDREVALLRTEQRAAKVASALTAAIKGLREAAEEIAADRAGVPSDGGFTIL